MGTFADDNVPFRGLTLDEAETLSLHIDAMKSGIDNPLDPDNCATFSYVLLKTIAIEMVEDEMYEMLKDYKKLFEIHDLPFITKIEKDLKGRFSKYEERFKQIKSL